MKQINKKSSLIKNTSAKDITMHLKNLTKNEIFLDIFVPVVLILLVILSIALPIYYSNAESIARNEVIEKHTVIKHTASGDIEYNTKFVGYNIGDLQEVNSFMYVNHFPGEFISPSEDVGSGRFYRQANIERVDELSVATKGTLQFVIFNYDKADIKANCNNQSCFKDVGSENNALLLYVPFAFDSATVWSQGEYYGTYGKMDNYYPDYFSSKEVKIRQNEAKPMKIKVIMPTRAEDIPDNKLEAARVITIHYRAERGLVFNNNIPMVGSMEKINQTVNEKYNLTISFMAVMVALIVGFIGILYIKMTKHHLPILGITICALLLLLAQFITINNKVLPGKVLASIALSLLVLFAILSCGAKQVHYKKTWTAITWISLINVLINSIVASVCSTYVVKLYMIISLTILCGMGFSYVVLTISSMSSVQSIGIIISLTVPLISIYGTYSLVSLVHPSCLTLSISALIILWYVFDDINFLEKRNKSLTKNLKAEVDTQTANLSSALKDRETLITFISHDLRKASVSVDMLATDMMMKTNNAEDMEIASQIKSKNKVLLNSFGDISQFVKRNFSDEEFATIKVNDIFNEVANTLSLDCEANGIMFNVEECRHSIRCKKKALISVMCNLIFNAIEHADCTAITLSAKKRKDRVEIYVHDDGKGIKDLDKVFSPYVSNDKGEGNMGLGLFIVKTETEAQGGNIYYKLENGSTFVISLLYAVE